MCTLTHPKNRPCGYAVDMLRTTSQSLRKRRGVRSPSCCSHRRIVAVNHLYTRLYRRPPAETDMQEYFRVSPPSVHQMVLTLERAGLIRRQPRTPRSIEVLVDSKDLPELI